MTTIGIDPSINSTGICVNKNGKNTYYIISSKATRKMKEFDNKYIHYLFYDKKSYKDMEYSDKEKVKTDNFLGLTGCIEQVLKKHKPDRAVMEGISYGSISGNSLADLAGLNYIIRYCLDKRGIPFSIVSPSGLKKFVCANGQAEKDVIIDSWKRLDPNIKNINDIKIDDCADAYFLAHINNNLDNEQ